MPVSEFFADQLQQMTEFMADPDQTVRCVLVDADLKPVLRKMLAGYGRDPATPHALIPCTAGFTTAGRFHTALLGELAESFAASADELHAAGVREPFTPADLARDPPELRTVLYLCSLAEGLPDHVGSLVVVLDPEAVDDPAGYRQVLARLADDVWSPWVKFLVIDDRISPRTVGLEELSKKVGRQTFYLPPDEFERRVRHAVMNNASLPPNVRRQYTGLLAGFAVARKDYALAAECYDQQAELTELDGVPAEEAQARYSLGNARLAAGDADAAAEAYARAVELTLDHQQPHLTAMALAQLGVCLHRLGRADQAADSFRAARAVCRGQDAPPLLAYVLDTQAQIALDGRDFATAERCWKDALAVYDGITASVFDDIREAGRGDILTKLEHLDQRTRQRARRAEPRTAREGSPCH